MRSNFALDIHTHTLASGHAYGTIREMARAAAEKGLELLGISEHAPGLPGTVDPMYYLNLRVIPRTLFGVRLIHGSEINILRGGTLSLEQPYIDQLDYGIAGLHEPCYHSADEKTNTDCVVAAMEHPKIVLISHPDDGHFPLDYRRLVSAAKETHTALEVNNSSLAPGSHRLNSAANYAAMLALCVRHQVPIVVNSDAHDPSQVANFTEARALLEQLRFPEELILNTSVQKFAEFIGLSLP